MTYAQKHYPPVTVDNKDNKAKTQRLLRSDCDHQSTPFTLLLSLLSTVTGGKGVWAGCLSTACCQSRWLFFCDSPTPHSGPSGYNHVRGNSNPAVAVVPGF